MTKQKRTHLKTNGHTLTGAKKQALHEAPERGSTVLYLRVDKKVHDKIVRVAKHRGWPHTVASVAGEALKARFR